MNHETSIFSLLALLAALCAAPRADAAVVLTPQIAGYSAGKFSSAAGSFAMTAANDAFIKPSVINVGGKPVTIPATLRMAANAGQYAKNGMRLNPWVIAGTLAAGWLADQMVSWDADSGQWVKGSTDYDWCVSSSSCCSSPMPVVTGPYSSVNCFAWVDRQTDVCNPGSVRATCAPGQPNPGITYTWNAFNPRPGVGAPMTPSDWDALPDPLPAIAPELPYTPYLPAGVPVDEPTYAPTIVPLGLPYTAPDGSTWQPMADIQPAGDGQVRVRLYDEQLTDPDGTPIPQPDRPTAEPAPEQPTQCDKYPDSIACSEYGTPEAMPNIPVHDLPINATPIPVGTSGQCPADITTSIYGLTWSYQPICDFASAVRPLIIGFAWLAFAYIVAGTVRT